MKAKLNFIRSLYKMNYNSYINYFKSIETIIPDRIIWSNSFLNFYPFETEMDQLPSPVIYKEKPKSAFENLIITKEFRGQIYYATKFENENWGTEFYFYNYSDKMNVISCDECYLLKLTDKTKDLLKRNKDNICDSLFRIKFLFNDDNDDEKMRLTQVEFVKLNNCGTIKEVLFYSFDKDLEEETFMIDGYSYGESNKVNFIERNGFYEDEKNVLDTRIFRFDYAHEKLKIYSQQMNLNGYFQEQQIY